MSVKDFFDALETGARTAIGVAIVAASVGIVVGTVTLTGLGLKMANGLVTLSGGNLIFTLILTMFASLILGMGIRQQLTIITSTIAAPALLLKLGVPIMVAHFFVFYFGLIIRFNASGLRSSICRCWYCEREPIKTGWYATKLAIAAWIIPYMFVMSPSLLLIDTTFIK